MTQGEMKDVIYQLLLSRRKIFAGLLLLCLGTTALRTVMLVGSEELVPKGRLHRKVKTVITEPQPSSRKSKHTRQSPASRPSRNRGARSGPSSRGGSAGGAKGAVGGLQIGSVAKHLRARKTESRPRSNNDLDYQRTTTENMMLDESGAYIWIDSEVQPTRSRQDDSDSVHGESEEKVEALLIEEDILIEDLILEDIDIQDSENEDMDLSLDALEVEEENDVFEEREIATAEAPANDTVENEASSSETDTDTDGGDTEDFLSELNATGESTGEKNEPEEELAERLAEKTELAKKTDVGGTRPLETFKKEKQVSADDVLLQNIDEQQSL